MMVYLLLLLFCIQLSTEATKSEEAVKKQNILVIHSYHKNFEWTEEIDEGIRSALNKEPNVENIFVEFLDYKRHQSSNLTSIYSNLFYEKYKADSIKVIITSDNGAYDFTTQFRNKYFPDVPIVFCGLNDFVNQIDLLEENTTGILESNKADNSFEAALKLFPQTTDIALITDTTLTSRNLANDFKISVAEKYPKMKLHEYINYDSNSLIDSINNLPQTTVALQIGYFFDKDGIYQDYEKRLPILSESIDKPIFAVWSFFLDYGIVGGKLTNPQLQGKEAAKIAVEILYGAKTNNIPVKKNMGNSWMYDYKMLAKFDKENLTLPEDAIIINAPSTTYSIDKNLLIATISFLVILIILVLWLYKQIIERREIEKQLIVAKERAETATRLKSEFLAQMSHEIRTPINIVLNYSNFIRDELQEQISADLAECFTSIETGSKRLIRTIDLILKVSEVQSGIVDVEKEETNLHEDILIPLKQEFDLAARQKGLNINLVSTGTEPTVLVDQYLMKQAISNLIDNAIKYSDKGVITLGVSDKNGKLEAYIADQGIGIEEEYLDLIFEPFSQEQQGYERIYEGNGLGLTLVKKYCALNEADIQIDSRKDVGSTFKIIFN